MKSYHRNRLAGLCLFCAIALYALPLAADDNYSAPKIGISAAVQGSQLDILVPIWTNSRFVITPSLGVTSVSAAVADWRYGLLARYNIHTGKVVPYFGARFAMLTMVPSGGDAVSDVVYGVALGGEYFLERHFSLGVEAQLNVASSGDESQRFGNPGGTNVNTAAAAMVSFYF